MRRGLVLLWVTALVASLVASAGPAALARKGKASPALVLRGRTTFTATTTSRFVIDIPRDIRTSDFRTGFSGDGRVIGYVIAKVGKPLPRAERLEAYAIGACDTAGCTAEEDPLPFRFGWDVGDYVEAGRYQVFVLADSAPVTLTVRTSALRGKAAYRGGEPIMAEVVTLPVGAASQDQNNVFSAGDFVSWEDRTPEFGVFGLWMYADSHAATAFGDCAYTDGSIGRPPVDDLNGAAFLPGCPTGDGFEFERISEMPGEKSGEILVSARWGNPVGLGGWFSSVSQVTSHGAVAMWVDYEK
jgi:hypothetical protein